jgi:hypothetical protein
MGSSDPATYDALSTESGVGWCSASCWSGDLTAGAAIRICGAMPTTTSVGGHRRGGSYITVEVAR